MFMKIFGKNLLKSQIMKAHLQQSTTLTNCNSVYFNGKRDVSMKE